MTENGIKSSSLKDSSASAGISEKTSSWVRMLYELSSRLPGFSEVGLIIKLSSKSLAISGSPEAENQTRINFFLLIITLKIKSK